MGRKIGNGHTVATKLIKEYSINTDHFTHGKKYKSMKGEKYGNLTIEEVKREIKGSQQRWFASCKCDCGNTKLYRCYEIRRGARKSCGCLSKNRWNMTGQQNPAFKGCENIGMVLFKKIKANADKRNLEFKITTSHINFLYKNQNKKCALTGIDIYFGRERASFETNASLDRIDNSKGYLNDNVRWVHKDINFMRKNLDDDYFIAMANLVAIHNPLKITNKDFEKMARKKGSKIYKKMPDK